MTILDDDKFNKRAAKGNRKYLDMAEDGEDYLVIRREAENDGLEGRELSMVMDMVDRVLIHNEVKKGASQAKMVSIIMGALVTLGGVGLLIFYYMNAGVIVYFNLIIIAIGVSALLKGITMK